VAVRVCDTRLAGNPALAGIKHLNRLEQVLARAEWDKDGDDREIAEGLMLEANTNNNNVIEGTMSNLFCVQAAADGPLLKTPALERCGVRGITRECVIDAARAAAIPVQESPVSLDELYQSKEVFLCNSLIGIWPVRQLEERVFPVGPVTTELSQALELMHE
jgi:4-amino-4-deoxychorismate lyase